MVKSIIISAMGCAVFSFSASKRRVLGSWKKLRFKSSLAVSKEKTVRLKPKTAGPMEKKKSDKDLNDSIRCLEQLVRTVLSGFSLQQIKQIINRSVFTKSRAWKPFCAR